MSDPTGPKNVSDESIRADHGGQLVNIRLVGMDRPFFTALAIVLGIFATIYAYECGRQTSQAVYWLQRNEAFLEQLSNQGVKVPEDLLTHKEK